MCPWYLVRFPRSACTRWLAENSLSLLPSLSSRLSSSCFLQSLMVLILTSTFLVGLLGSRVIHIREG